MGLKELKLYLALSLTIISLVSSAKPKVVKPDHLFNEHCLAAAIYEEARNDDKGKEIVTEVVMNRALSGFTKPEETGAVKKPLVSQDQRELLDICKVIKTPHQFSWYKPHSLWKARPEKQAWEDAKQTAKKS